MMEVDLKIARDTIVGVLRLASEPVGVRFIPQGEAVPEEGDAFERTWPAGQRGDDRVA